jgi:hypothetical protein
LDIFDNNQVVLAAVSLQNLLQPKNHNRTEAIASKSYVEFISEERAVAYLNAQLRLKKNSSFHTIKKASNLDLNIFLVYHPMNITPNTVM